MLTDWLKPTTGVASAFFLLAHPDDEFFCLPLIAAEARGGRTVHVAFLTDGGSLAVTREQESLRVLVAAGVNPVHVTFAGREHGWRDGELYLRVAAARAWVASYLGSLANCVRVYVPAYEGGHHDHDCCFGLVAALFRDRQTPATCLQFPLYTGRALPGALFSCMNAIPENGETFFLRLSPGEAVRAWLVAGSYPSQWKTWIALAPASMWGYLVRRSVVVQRVDPARVQGPPHVGVPYFERRFGVRADLVLEALRQL